tara:strand:- start:404 stop:523 length:120 start_codon:yes stop_codon:yes gene_type:complete
VVPVQAIRLNIWSLPEEEEEVVEVPMPTTEQEPVEPVEC